MPIPNKWVILSFASLVLSDFSNYTLVDDDPEIIILENDDDWFDFCEMTWRILCICFLLLSLWYAPNGMTKWVLRATQGAI